MTLRTRFTLAVAAAVAAVALAITAVAFLVVRADLTSQVQHELRQQAAVVEQLAQRYHGHIPAGWVPRDSGRFGAVSAYAQVVTAHGTVRAPAGDSRLLPATTAAEQVAAGQRGSYYTETTLNGVRAMVLTTPVAPDLAVQLAVPLSAVDAELGSIGATLVVLSAAGVGLAALAGWWVARAGLAPVGRLAAVAEQVTATGDPGRRVEVDRADELGRLAASFNTMLGALQRSLAAQRQLVSDASHELRTPLTSLRVNAELLAAEPGLPQAERQEVLDRVVAQVAELSELVTGVTELAKGEALDAAPGEVDLAGVVRAALDGARRDWPRAVFRAALEPCAVLGDRERLRTAVRSLLDNAAKFSPPGSLVEVRLHGAELTVRDHGPGIPPADLPYVFDRFYRAAAARGVPGSGLGLSIVRQVAEGYGGTVRAEVPADGGTLVRLQMTRALPGADPGGTHAVIAQDRRPMVGGRLSRTARGITVRTCTSGAEHRSSLRDGTGSWRRWQARSWPIPADCNNAGDPAFSRREKGVCRHPAGSRLTRPSAELRLSRASATFHGDRCCRRGQLSRAAVGYLGGGSGPGPLGHAACRIHVFPGSSPSWTRRRVRPSPRARGRLRAEARARAAPAR